MTDAGPFFSLADHTIYIVSESDAYPLIEGAGKVLKCVKQQDYLTRARYTWQGSARGRSEYDLLTFSNLTKEFNGSQVSCFAVLHHIGANYVTVEDSNTLVLKVYCKYTTTKCYAISFPKFCKMNELKAK